MMALVLYVWRIGDGMGSRLWNRRNPLNVTYLGTRGK